MWLVFLQDDGHTIYAIYPNEYRRCCPLFMPPPLGAGGMMFSGCPSVRPFEAWNTLFRPVHGSVGPHYQTWPFYGMSVRPSVRRGFRAFVGEHMEGWPEILHADVYWPPSELIRLWSQSVDFPPFDATLTYWNGSNLAFPGISWRTHGGNGLKFCMLLYPDHLQNWLYYGYSLLIFSILVLF